MLTDAVTEAIDVSTPLAANLAPVAPALRTYQNIEQELSRTFLERDETIRAVMLTVLARQHAVLLGPPGTAKSDMINSLSDRIAGPSGTAQFFVYLMTKQTNEEEIFGPPDVNAFRQGIYQRVVARKLPTAHFTFLDELFKANTAISNALLTAMNERLYDDGQGRVQIPLISLFGASNELPQGEELAAFWDRLVTRLMVTYVSDSVFGQLLRMATQARQAPTTLDLQDLEALQAMVLTLPIPNTVYEAMITLRKDLLAKGIIASDRRWLQMLRFVQASALMEGRDRVEEDDLIVMKDALWSNPEQRQDIARMAAKLANPLNGKAVELGDQAASVFEPAMNAQRGEEESDGNKMNITVEALAKIKSIRAQLQRLRDQAAAQGRNPQKIERELGKVKAMQMQLGQIVVAD
jgi:MoxR-like ATPase